MLRRRLGDLSDPIMDPFSDHAAVLADAVERWEVTPVAFGSGGVHQGVDVGIDARFGGGEVPEHVLGDGALVAEVPTDPRLLCFRTPGDLLGRESDLEVRGVGEGAVELAEEVAQGWGGHQ